MFFAKEAWSVLLAHHLFNRPLSRNLAAPHEKRDRKEISQAAAMRTAAGVSPDAQLAGVICVGLAQTRAVQLRNLRLACRVALYQRRLHFAQSACVVRRVSVSLLVECRDEPLGATDELDALCLVFCEREAAHAATDQRPIDGGQGKHQHSFACLPAATAAPRCCRHLAGTAAAAAAVRRNIHWYKTKLDGCIHTNGPRVCSTDRRLDLLSLRSWWR